MSTPVIPSLIQPDRDLETFEFFVKSEELSGLNVILSLLSRDPHANVLHAVLGKLGEPTPSCGFVVQSTPLGFRSMLVSGSGGTIDPLRWSTILEFQLYGYKDSKRSEDYITDEGGEDPRWKTAVASGTQPTRGLQAEIPHIRVMNTSHVSKSHPDGKNKPHLFAWTVRIYRLGELVGVYRAFKYVTIRAKTKDVFKPTYYFLQPNDPTLKYIPEKFGELTKYNTWDKSPTHSGQLHAMRLCPKGFPCGIVPLPAPKYQSTPTDGATLPAPASSSPSVPMDFPTNGGASAQPQQCPSSLLPPNEHDLIFNGTLAMDPSLPDHHEGGMLAATPQNTQLPTAVSTVPDALTYDDPIDALFQSSQDDHCGFLSHPTTALDPACFRGDFADALHSDVESTFYPFSPGSQPVSPSTTLPRQMTELEKSFMNDFLDPTTLVRDELPNRSNPIPCETHAHLPDPRTALNMRGTPSDYPPPSPVPNAFTAAPVRAQPIPACGSVVVNTSFMFNAFESFVKSTDFMEAFQRHMNGLILSRGVAPISHNAQQVIMMGSQIAPNLFVPPPASSPMVRGVVQPIAPAVASVPNPKKRPAPQAVGLARKPPAPCGFMFPYFPLPVAGPPQRYNTGPAARVAPAAPLGMTPPTPTAGISFCRNPQPR